MKWIALGVIRFYQLTLSRLTPSSCRFVPTCSQYGYEAIGKFGLRKGGWLAIRRISRCHPWSKGGLDPVP
ncbi:MAG: membrane protein insertion efficiency factor YidD [Dehalococcoidia bacterium]|nr:membrane protein insertion efficiency factor YidD [Dehalococcoidia bacterium]